VTPYNVAVGYQHFRGPCCLHLQVGILWQHYMVLQPRIPELEYSLPWKPQTSHSRNITKLDHITSSFQSHQQRAEQVWSEMDMSKNASHLHCVNWYDSIGIQ